MPLSFTSLFAVFFFLFVRRMQRVVRLVAVGLAEVVGIQRLDDRIFVRLSELGFLIGVVDRFGSERLNVDVVAHARRNDRLAAAVNVKSG